MPKSLPLSHAGTDALCFLETWSCVRAGVVPARSAAVCNKGGNFKVGGAIEVDASRSPQHTGRLGELCTGEAVRVAPLKHVFRVLQKHATRVNSGEPVPCEAACGTVSGSVVCGSRTKGAVT